MSEVQQSPLYGQYMKRLKWTVLSVGGVQIFFRHFPITGAMMKIHRPEKLPSVNVLIPLIQKHNIKTLVIEPTLTQNKRELNTWSRNISSSVKLYTGVPYLPTKTIGVDLKPKDEDIFRHFSEAKRRAVRRANKLGVVVKASVNISDLIRIKNKSSGFLGFITTTGLRQLWDIFSPKHANILLAYKSDKIIGGVLLLFWDHIASYWIAGATHEGKKMFAPTLLAWESLRVSKKHGCTTFDFVGVWDERTPRLNRDWFGFTKFKEGFGGEVLYYPLLGKEPAGGQTGN